MRASLPSLTRRRLLATTGAAAVVVGTSGPTAIAAPRRRRWRNRLAYDGLRNGFGIRVPGELGHRPLTLHSVSDVAGTTRRGKPLAGREDAFILTFAATWTPLLEQGTYELHHRRMGTTKLFLVPAGERGLKHLYSAVINHAI